MTRVPGMLMVGASGRNAGKTEFACSVIRKFGRGHEIVGAKVTTIGERGGACPRGGEGCGVCSSLEGNYCIVEETGALPGKDTSRLLAAGARRVFWLRVLREHLDEGLGALLERIGIGTITVCESNSLRLVAEPDLFFIVKARADEGCKRSAKNVMQYVDRVVLSDDATFDICLDDVSIVGGKWALRRDATAIILAGGRNSRMGADKSMLPIGGRPMIQHVLEQLRPHFKEILISSSDADKYAFLGERVVGDEVPGQGPLMGMASSLEASKHDLAFVIACDIPVLDADLVLKMLREAEGYDGVVPLADGSLPEPLFAVYRKSVIAAAREVLSSGKRKVSEVFAQLRIKFINLDKPVRNINTPADYEEFRKAYGDAV